MALSVAAKTVELAAGVFAFVQDDGGFCVSNAGIIAGRSGTTVVDALFTPAMTRALLDEVRRVAPQPVERLVNSHHHVDHTLGNALFPANVPIVAHERCAEDMRRTGASVLDVIARMAPHFAEDLRDAALRLPDATFRNSMLELDDGRRPIVIRHFGAAHTRSDIVVHLPEERVCFIGDLGFFGVTPLAHEGHFGGWRSAIDCIIDEVDADVLIPGHGQPGTKADLRRMSGYIDLLREQARPAFDAGASREDAARSIDLGEYASWLEPERLQMNVQRMYREFAGELDWLVEEEA